MKDRTFLVIVVLLAISSLVMIGIRQWGASERERRFKEWLRDITRYDGAEGETIVAFDERTDQWLTELREESVEETLLKLTGATEYVAGFALNLTSGYSMRNEEGREGLFYRPVIEVILSNRRFRKAYEDLQKTNREQAAKLLTNNIRNNLMVLRTMLQEDRDKVARGEHTGVILIPLSSSVEYAARPTSRFDIPPTRMGRKYAVFSYLLLASWLELREVRPAVEEVILFASEEYEFFNTMDFGEETYSFKAGVIGQSLYNPSLLVTATLCDPAWSTDKNKRLETKLVNCEVVDYTFAG